MADLTSSLAPTAAPTGPVEPWTAAQASPDTYTPPENPSDLMEMPEMPEAQQPAFQISDIPKLAQEPEFKALPPDRQENTFDKLVGNVTSQIQQDPGLTPEIWQKYNQKVDAIRASFAPSTLSSIGQGTVDTVKGLGKTIASVPGAIPPAVQHPIEMAKTVGKSAVYNVGGWITGASHTVQRHTPGTTAHELDGKVDDLKKKIDEGKEFPVGNADKQVDYVKQKSKELAPLQDKMDSLAMVNRLESPENAMLLSTYIHTRNPKAWAALKHNLTQTGLERQQEDRKEGIDRSAGAQAFDAWWGKGAHEHLIGASDPSNLLFFLRAAKAAAAAGRLMKAAKFTGEMAAYGAANAVRSGDPSLSDVGEEVLKSILAGSIIHAGGKVAKRLIGGKPKASAESKSPEKEGETEPTPPSAEPPMPSASGTPSREAWAGTVPPEPPQTTNAGAEQPPSGTTIAHADTDPRAIEAGFGVPERGAKWTEASAQAEAAKRMADPNYATKLVQFYKANPDVRVDPVNAIVLGELLARQGDAFEHQRAALKAMPEDAPGRPAAVQAFSELESAYRDTLEATTKAGSAAGSELRARQIARAKEQFESLPMLLATLEAKGKVSPETRAQVEKDFDANKSQTETAAKSDAKAKANKKAEEHGPVQETAKTNAKGVKKSEKQDIDAAAKAARERLKKGGIQISSASSGEGPAVSAEAFNRAKAILSKTRIGRVLLQRIKIMPDWERAIHLRDFSPEEMNLLKTAEGFHDPQTGKSVVIRDNIRPQPGETPEAAVIRVITHELEGHERNNWMRAHDPAYNRQWLKLARAVPQAELDALSQRYPHLKGNPDALALEWYAQQAERLGRGEIPHPQSLLGEFWQAVKDFLNRLMGKETATDQMVRDLIARGRAVPESLEGVGGEEGGVEVQHSQPNSSLDDLGIIAASHIANGEKDVGAKLVQEFGETVKPHLTAIIDHGNKILEKYKADVKTQALAQIEKVKANLKGDVPDELHSHAAALAKAHAYADPSLTGEAPEHAQTLVSRVQADLASAGHDLTPSETARAITNYGEQPEPKLNPAQKRLRELKAQILADEKKADAEDGKVPFVRRIFSKPSDVMRRKITELRDLVRKIENEEVQAGRMKTAQQKREAQLENQIADLNSQIADPLHKGREPRPKLPETSNITRLREQRDALQKHLDTLRGHEVTAEEYNRRRINAANASRDYWKDRTAQNKFRPDLPVTHPLNEEATAAIKGAKEAKAEFDAAAEASGALAERKLEATIKRLNDRIKTVGDTLGDAAKNPQNYDRRNVAALKNELARLNKIKSSERLQKARDAREASKALKIEMDRNISSLERITADARRKGKPLMAQEAELAGLRAERQQNDAPELQRYKELQQKRAARANDREADVKRTGQPPAPKSKRQIQLDDEAREDEVKRILAERKLRNTILNAELKQQPWYQQMLRYPSRVKRGLVLASAPIYFKLAIAGNVARPFMTMAEETVGRTFLRGLMPDVFRNAPSEGRGASSWDSMQAYKRGYFRGYAEMPQVIKTGMTRNQALYGKDAKLNQPKIEDYVLGHSHMAFKAPAWEAAFEMSVENRIASANYESADKVPPATLNQMRRAAAKDADYAIYKNDNVLNDYYSKALAAGSRTGTAGQMITEALRFENVIVKIPTNLVGEASKYLLGSVAAPAKLAFLKAKQEGRITPEQADSIARTFKKGMTFATLVGIAATVPGAIKVGGDYVQGEKRKKSDLQPGDVELFGVKMPHIATHAGVFSAAQALGTGIRDAQNKGTLPHGAAQSIWSLAENVPMIRGTGEFLSSIGAGKEKEGARSKALKGMIPGPVRVWAESPDYHGPSNIAKRIFWDADREHVTNRGSTFQSGIPNLGLPFLPSRQQLPIKRPR